MDTDDHVCSLSSHYCLLRPRYLNPSQTHAFARIPSLFLRDVSRIANAPGSFNSTHSDPPLPFQRDVGQFMPARRRNWGWMNTSGVPHKLGGPCCASRNMSYNVCCGSSLPSNILPSLPTDVSNPATRTKRHPTTPITQRQ